MRRLFDVDPLTGTRTWFEADGAGEEYTLRTEQEVSPLLDLTKYTYNNDGGSWRGDVHHVASLPNAVWFDLKQKGIIDDEKAFRKWLDDPANRFFRVKPGKLSR